MSLYEIDNDIKILETNKKKQCVGCNKFYIGEIGLLQHHTRNLLCKYWTSIINSDERACKIQKLYHSNYNLTCSSCKTIFSNMGNLNKHLRNNITCQKIDLYNIYLEKNTTDLEIIDESITMYDKTKKFDVYPLDVTNVSKYGAAPPVSNSTLIHIIWNLLLTDKTQVKNLDKEIEQNNIKLIIAIIPSKESIDYLELNKKVNTIVIEYGDNYNSIINDDILKLYEECYNKIKELQINRENTLIFCNNGYQRSLPFICNYLITHHNDEVPNLDRALDIVLSQADKTNFSNIKEPTKNNLINLKKEDGSVLFK